jgi:hypothetical protein
MPPDLGRFDMERISARKPYTQHHLHVSRENPNP